MCVLGIVFAHVCRTPNFPLPPELIEGLCLFCLPLFLVLSGFLITSILLKEWRRDANISLPRFYFRRTMRLTPALYFMVAVVGVLSANHVMQLNSGELSGALTYTVNYRSGAGYHLGHLWSLGIEEQFYLAWPFALKKLGPPRATWFLIAILAAAPVFRFIGGREPAFSFLVWSDSLAAGCLLALLQDRLPSNRFYAGLLRSAWFFLLPSTAVLLGFVPLASRAQTWVRSVVSMALAISMDWVMRNRESLIARFFNLRPLVVVGVAGYSVYLWQQQFANPYSHKPWCAFPVNVVLAIGFGMLSYRFVEMPFMRLRSTLERKYNERHGAAPRGAPAAVPTAIPMPVPSSLAGTLPNPAEPSMLS